MRGAISFCFPFDCLVRNLFDVFEIVLDEAFVLVRLHCSFIGGKCVSILTCFIHVFFHMATYNLDTWSKIILPHGETSFVMFMGKMDRW